MADKIAERLHADIAEIHPEKPYSDADLNWHDEQSRTTIEQHDHNSRVAIKDDLPDISDYDTIVLGHPIWWGIPPRMFSTVIDQLDLNGKRLALFGTSSSTGYDRSQSYFERAVKENNYDTEILPGAALHNDGQLEQWLKNLK